MPFASAVVEDGQLELQNADCLSFVGARRSPELHAGWQSLSESEPLMLMSLELAHVVHVMAPELPDVGCAA